MSGFVKKSVPPPDVKEGQILKAKILDIKKVTSQWKNDDGSPKEQAQFELELENGYHTRSWVPYYSTPSDKSVIGKLALMLEQATKQRFENVDEFLVALKRFGYVFVKVKGFREYEDKLYPNFALFADKLPGDVAAK